MTADNPEAPLRGAVDLSHLKSGAANAAPAAPAGAPAGAPEGAGAPGAPGASGASGASGGEGGLVTPVTVTEQSLNELAQQSTEVPVVLVFLSSASPASKELVERMRRIVTQYQGRFVLGTCDIDVQGGIAQALQINAVPTVMALIAARPAPLFQGSADDEQIRGVLDQVLEVAQQNGVTGTVAAGPAPEPEPEPIPPLHQEAYDAIEREDYAAAVDAYDRALRENPKDADAKAGRAQVSLLERTMSADLAAVRKAAADNPTDVDAQLAVADMDMVGGQIEDAFGRLLDVIRTVFGDDRDAVRVRLIDYFDVVGPTDPRVVQARQQLAAALF